MLPRLLRRCLILTTAVTAAGLSGLGCLPQASVEIFGISLSPAFTLDRQPVLLDSAGQPIVDPLEGPFTRAPGKVASLLYPELAGIDGLLQADCFWTGRAGGGGDSVLLNWEAVVWVPLEHQGKYLPPGDEDISACRLNDPLTRQPKHLTSDHAPTAPTVAVGFPRESLAALAIRYEDGVIEPREQDLTAPFMGVSLAARLAPQANPDRVCDPSNFATGPEVQISPGVWSYSGLSTVSGELELCAGRGRRVIPEEDAHLRAYIANPVDPTMPVEQWLGAVMVAEDGERLVRQATAQQNDVVWSSQHWQENFSPSIRVEAVRLLRRIGGVGTFLEQGDLASQTLCIRDGVSGCRYQLSSEKNADDHVLWRPAAGAGGTVLQLTPTYDVDLLALLEPDKFIPNPLQWRASPHNPNDVYFVFDLTVTLAPVGVRMDPLTSLGRVPPGTTRFTQVTLSNVGGRSVSIDGLDVLADDPTEFTTMLLSNPKLVPIEVDFIDSEGGTEIQLGEGYAEFPLFEIVQQEDALLLHRNDLGGQTFTRNGHQLSFDGPTALYTDPAADFEPPLASNQRRPLGAISYLPLPTPALLGPGEHLRIRVGFEPTSPGERNAQLQVRYHDPLDGAADTLLSTVVAYAEYGPDPMVLPATLILEDLPLQHVRSLLLFNHGDLPLEVNNHGVRGPEAARVNPVNVPPASFAVAPGDSEVLTLEYLDTCPFPDQLIEHQAEYWLDSNVGELVVPIHMRSTQCVSQ